MLCLKARDCSRYCHVNTHFRVKISVDLRIFNNVVKKRPIDIHIGMRTVGPKAIKPLLPSQSIEVVNSMSKRNNGASVMKRGEPHRAIHNYDTLRVVEQCRQMTRFNIAKSSLNT